MKCLRQRLRESGPGLVAAITAVWLSSYPLASNAQLRIELENGLLTLEADEVPLAEIIHALAQQAGFEVTLNGDFDTPVTITLTQTPLSEALQRLLADTGRMITYTPPQPQQTERQIQRLWLFEPKSDSEIATTEPRSGNTAESSAQDDPRARSEEVLKIAQSGNVAAAVSKLTQILQEDPDEMVRTQAVIALGGLQNVQALSVLESALDDESFSVRAQAVQSLGQVRHEHATEILGDVLLNEDDVRLRVIAAQGLGNHDSSLAQTLLEAAQNDPDQQVREAVTKSVSPDGNAETQPEAQNNQ